MKCPRCHRSVLKDAARCVFCGQVLGPKNSWKFLVFALILLGFMGVGFWIFRSDIMALVLQVPNQTAQEQGSQNQVNPNIEEQNAQVTLSIQDSVDWAVQTINSAMVHKDCIKAIPALKVLVRLRPSPDSWSLLGKCYLQENQVDSAIAALKTAKTEGSPENLEDWITKAERLKLEDRDLARMESPHFSLQVEGKANTWKAADSLLAKLERSYDKLSVIWSYYPEQKIPAVFYERRHLADRHLPDWTGALFDGKVRIPYEALAGGGAIDRILLHEVGHAFARELAMGVSLPPWFDEGLAQHIDGTVLNPQVLAEGPADFDALQMNFLTQSDPQEAHRLYQTSLGMFQILFKKYAKENYGEIRKVLAGLSEGVPLTELIESRWGVDPRGLHRELTQQLQGNHVSEHSDP